MPDAREERGLLRKRAAVADHREGVHLEAVVVVEAERLLNPHAGVELKARGLEPVAAARMAAVKDWHIVLLGHGVYRIKEAQEVFLSVDVLLAVGAEENIMSFLQSKALVHVARLYLGKVLMKHLRHRAARDVGALGRQAALREVAPRVLAVCEVHVADDVNDAPVGLLRKALVLAAVARLHVEYRDVQALRPYHAQAAVGVAQNEHGVGPCRGHELVARVDDVTAGRPEVVPHSVHIDLGLREPEVAEEYAVEVVVVVLTRVGENHVEVLPALGDDGRKADYLRARAHDYQQFQPAVVLKTDIGVVGS